MGRFGEVGAPELFQFLMEWVFGNIFEWGGKLSRVTLGSIWGRALGFVFGMMFGVGIVLLKSCSLGASIADNVERSNGAIQWNIQFTRLIHDWEVEVLASFYRSLYSCKLREDGEDKLWWVPSRKGVSKLSLSIEPSRPTGSYPFLGRAFGDQRLLREAFFVWTAACSKILTLDGESAMSGRSRSAVVWKMVPLCIMWCI